MSGSHTGLIVVLLSRTEVKEDLCCSLESCCLPGRSYRFTDTDPGLDLEHTVDLDCNATDFIRISEHQGFNVLNLVKRFHIRVSEPTQLKL